MPILVPINLVGWILVCLVLFATFPRRHAVVIGILGAWLFLPSGGIDFRGLPPYTKGSAFSYGILLSTLIFCPDRLSRLRPSLLDVPAFFYCCVCPITTAMMNGLTLYDGLSDTNSQLTLWGLPYLIGRIHFDEPRALRDLMIGLVLGGLIYVPLCLFEIAFGPVLASKLYGFRLYMEARLGGWRPRVFMHRGLELGLWMTMCCLTGVWLKVSGGLKRIASVSFSLFWLPILFATTIACRASGAIGLLGVSIAVTWLSTRFKQRIWLGLLAASVVLYVGVRATNVWDYSGLIEFLTNNFDADRAESLEFRFRNEDLLIEKAMQRPIFGWGGYGRSRIYDHTGKDISITDGLVVIIQGIHGLAGVATFLGIFIAPSLAFVMRFPARRWTEPDVAAMAAAASICSIYMIDCTQNAFPNGVYVVTAGALAAVIIADRRTGGRLLDDRDFANYSMSDVAAVEYVPLSPEGRLADRYIELARTLRQAGDYDGSESARRHALDLLNVCVEQAPNDQHAIRRRLDCRNDLAWLLATWPNPEPGAREEAVALANATVQAAPKESTYWNTLALAYSRVGSDADALAAARRSMELDASWNGYDMAVLALADARMGRPEEAAVWLAEARKWRQAHRTADGSLDALIHETESVLKV